MGEIEETTKNRTIAEDSELLDEPLSGENIDEALKNVSADVPESLQQVAQGIEIAQNDDATIKIKDTSQAVGMAADETDQPEQAEVTDNQTGIVLNVAAVLLLMLASGSYDPEATEANSRVRDHSPPAEQSYQYKSMDRRWTRLYAKYDGLQDDDKLEVHYEKDGSGFHAVEAQDVINFLWSDQPHNVNFFHRMTPERREQAVNDEDKAVVELPGDDVATIALQPTMDRVERTIEGDESHNNDYNEQHEETEERSRQRRDRADRDRRSERREAERAEREQQRASVGPHEAFKNFLERHDYGEYTTIEGFNETGKAFTDKAYDVMDEMDGEPTGITDLGSRAPSRGEYERYDYVLKFKGDDFNVNWMGVQTKDSPYVDNEVKASAKLEVKNSMRNYFQVEDLDDLKVVSASAGEALRKDDEILNDIDNVQDGEDVTDFTDYSDWKPTQFKGIHDQEDRVKKSLDVLETGSELALLVGALTGEEDIIEAGAAGYGSSRLFQHLQSTEYEMPSLDGEPRTVAFLVADENKVEDSLDGEFGNVFADDTFAMVKIRLDKRQ